jgi:hypothetical protein
MNSTSGCAIPAGTAEAPAQGEWTCRLIPGGGRRYALHLSGSLHYAWAGRLAAGLAARHISIVRATAMRGETRWTADIDFDALQDEMEPSALDFIALMREQRPLQGAERLALASCRVTRTRSDAEVEIRGEDAVGLLGRILLLFAELGLFPRAMRVETRGAAVRDVFLLQNLWGQPPPEELVAVLRTQLGALLSPR